MREVEHAAASTIRRRLAALSSLYKHLVRHRHAAKNPVTELERPAINRDEGSTLAFSKTQARKMLDMPPTETPKGRPHVAGLSDRAIPADIRRAAAEARRISGSRSEGRKLVAAGVARS